MYKIRMAGRDKVALEYGCIFKYNYNQSIVTGNNKLVDYKVTLEFFKDNKVYCLKVLHFDKLQKDFLSPVLYTYSDYNKARKHLTILNKFYS
jgi:hypothetical protein